MNTIYKIALVLVIIGAANWGFVGLFDIDFYKSNGVLYFGEFNLRFGGSGYAISKMGVNLPGMYIKILRGDNLFDMTKEITGTSSFVNERMCIDDWYAGYLTTKEYRRIVESSNISFVSDEDDKAPQNALQKFFLKRRMKRFLKFFLSINN